MPLYRAPQRIKHLIAASPSTIANTTTETVFAPTQTIKANTLKIGKLYRIKAVGVYSSIASSPGNFAFKIRLGSTSLAGTGNNGLSSSITQNLFTLEAEMIVLSTGVSGTVEVQGRVAFNTSGVNAQSVQLRNTGVVTADTTVDQALGISWQFSVADVGNTATLRQIVIQEVN